MTKHRERFDCKLGSKCKGTARPTVHLALSPWALRFHCNRKLFQQFLLRCRSFAPGYKRCPEFSMCPCNRGLIKKVLSLQLLHSLRTQMYFRRSFLSPEITRAGVVSYNLIGQQPNKRSYVTEIVMQLELEDVPFRGRETTAGNTSAFTG